ncbi:Macrophage migration inhibitory factor [Hondaea fermentalgiana]|uniref:Macrophage migration inhibitory factor n=1 Tax=Hondaea fermentalgiana TaxID=2315210 RepID=A0A2R5GE04_9STRA|nr:Macrophage migration inhibitory factor [Hondaea fermentalgiana]|eukprot:GBG26024.1 Macrophage migration inhibitory factor [Hondaea fermentalgiana]
MPLVRIATTFAPTPAQAEKVMAAVTKTLAQQFDVPEGFVHVHIMPSQLMSWGGTFGNTTVVDIRALADQLSDESRVSLGASVTSTLSEWTPPDRTEIIYQAVTLDDVVIDGTVISKRS